MRKLETLYESEDRNWRIVRGLNLAPNHNGMATVANHTFCKSEEAELGPQSWYAHDDNPVCWDCDVEVPEDIQTLMALYTFGDPNA